MKELQDNISGTTTEVVKRLIHGYEDTEDDENRSNTTGGTTADDTGVEEFDSSVIDPPQATESATKTGSGDDRTISGELRGDTDGTTGDMSFQEDPVDDTPDTSTESTDASEHEYGHTVRPEDLTEKQLETLRAIREQPSATQADLAEELGVTSATINQRVNSIDEFDWSKRQTFTTTLYERGKPSGTGATNREPDVNDRTVEPADEISTPMSEPNDPSPSNDRESATDSYDERCAELTDQVSELTEQIETLEQRLETQTPTSGPLLADPELGHKVIHACFAAEQISEEEELRILETILTDQ